MNDIIPRFPLAEGIDAALGWLTSVLAGLTRAISSVMSTGIKNMVNLLLTVPELILIAIIGGIAWKLAGRRVAIWSTVGLLFIWNLGLWGPTVSTIALVILATLIAIGIGIPLGIGGALSDKMFNILRPILDFMQTMPAFVYLIPAIPFFGLGTVSAIFSTVIFAIPPAIRLTTLGIRQIDKEMIEACDSFGATTRQRLLKVQLPLAMPTIMAGINQTIMLALSMVVIASMIGAGGLGGEVWRAIQRLRAGAGFEAGIAVVIVAMILDRITQAIAHRDRRVVE
jgi:glycine betaine/proline transport system permease protein